MQSCKGQHDFSPATVSDHKIAVFVFDIICSTMDPGKIA